MPKIYKARVLEVIQIKDNHYTNINTLMFKVQVAKGIEPVNMFYDQLKYCYPDALIDFYQSKCGFLNQQTPQQDQQTPDNEDMLDYDAYTFGTGSSILEYINSLTINVPKKQSISDEKGQSEKQKVFGYEANQFYDKFIIGSEQSESNSSERSKKRDKKRKVREIELE